MAIACATLANGTNESAGATTVVAGAFTPSSNAILAVYVASFIVFGAPTQAALSGGSLSYTARDDFSYTVGVTGVRLGAWTAPTGSVGSMSVTATWGVAQGAAVIDAIDVSASDLTNPVVQVDHSQSNGTAAQVSGNAFPAAVTTGNGVLAFGSCGTASTGQTPDTGYTALDYRNGTNADVFSLWRNDANNDPGTTLSTAVDWGFLAMEVQVPQAAFDPSLMQARQAGQTQPVQVPVAIVSY